MKKTNGITLVALVVTIVVLLILAGVSINFMLGENRLITQEKVGVNTEIYYLENSYDKSNSITFSEEIAKTKDEMQSNEFLELLNTNEEIWIKDTNNINLGYPILYWQKVS